MEIMQIKDCQNILKIGQKLETEEERKCNQLLRNPNTIKWLGERKNNLDKEIKEIEGKILEKREVLSKKKLKESEKEKISKELESKINGLNLIKISDSDKNLQVKLEGQINEAEKKIKEHDSTINLYQKFKYEIDEKIKNKEAEERNLEAHISSARSELSSAEIKYKSMMEDPCAHLKIGLFGGKIGCSDEIERRQGNWHTDSTTCWKRSPEISSACEQREKKKVQEKKSMKETYEIMLKWKIKELNEEKDNSQVYAKGITVANNMKNAEIAKKAQYTKEKQEVEVRMKGVLDQKSSLEAEIEKQKAEQILINDALLSLEESAKNFDSRALETQKGALEQEFQDADAFEYKLIEYLKVDITGQYHQQQDL
jgi:hypothetical protein